MLTLKQNQTNKVQNKEAFTLIEIMIVVAIGALLMLMGLGGYKFLQRMKVSQTQSKINTLRSSIGMYKSQVGEYPQNLNELITGPTNPKLRGGWGGEELASEKELKDAWDRQFVYEVNQRGSAEPYELYSTGKSGEERYTGTQT